MAGVAHEAPLALERASQALDHVVERLAQAADLVARRGQRQELVAAVERDALRPAAHRLHGPQGCRSQAVADQRGEGDGERPADGEGRHDSGQRLVAIVERLADDEHDGLAGGQPWPRQHARGALDPGDLAFDYHLVVIVGDAADLRRAQDGPARPADRRQHAAAGRDDLLEALLVLLQRVRAEVGDGTDGGGSRAQPRVDRLGEVGAQPQVDEQPGRHQHEHHRQREGRGQPGTDRHAAHVPPSLRSRYPAPRTVSSDVTPNGRSIFWRR